MSTNQSNPDSSNTASPADAQLASLLLEFIRKNPQSVNGILAGLPSSARLAIQPSQGSTTHGDIVEIPRAQFPDITRPSGASAQTGAAAQPSSPLPVRPQWVSRAEPAGATPYHMQAGRKPAGSVPAPRHPAGSVSPMTFQGVFEEARITPGGRGNRLGASATKKIGPPGARVSLVLEDNTSPEVAPALIEGSVPRPAQTVSRPPPSKTPRGSFALSRLKQVCTWLPPYPLTDVITLTRAFQ